MDTKKAKKINLKNKEDGTMEQEVEGIMNAIKGDQVQSGIIPTSGAIVVKNFAGKKTKIDKSTVIKGRQFFVKKGTSWEDIDFFCRKNINFTSKDFE